MLGLTVGTCSRAADKTFIDYIQPMPIESALVSDVWGAPGVLPRDPQNGLEDETMERWDYWDGQIIKAPDGKFHMFASRWDQALAIVDGGDPWPCVPSATKSPTCTLSTRE